MIDTVFLFCFFTPKITFLKKMKYKYYSPGLFFMKL